MKWLFNKKKKTCTKISGESESNNTPYRNRKEETKHLASILLLELLENEERWPLIL